MHTLRSFVLLYYPHTRIGHEQCWANLHRFASGIFGILSKCRKRRLL